MIIYILLLAILIILSLSFSTKVNKNLSKPSYPHIFIGFLISSLSTAGMVNFVLNTHAPGYPRIIYALLASLLTPFVISSVFGFILGVTDKSILNNYILGALYSVWFIPIGFFIF